jgi:hypothetical protein
LQAAAAAAGGTPPFDLAEAGAEVVCFLTAPQELQERMRLLLEQQVLRLLRVRSAGQEATARSTQQPLSQREAAGEDLAISFPPMLRGATAVLVAAPVGEALEPQ